MKYSGVGMLFLAVMLLSGCAESNSHESYVPTAKPTGLEEEEGPLKDSLKKVFFEQLYYAAEGTNVDSIRQENWKIQYQEKQRRKKESNSRTNEESFANEYITAIWHERGPDNEAGDMREVDFFQATEEIYGISTAGHLVKGQLDGSPWSILNHDIRFEREVLEVVPHNAGKRIFAVYGEDVENKEIRFSDDEGETWTKGTGFSFYDHWGRSRRLYTLSDQNTLYYLVHTWSESPWGQLIQLYTSTDKGLTYNKVWDTPVGYNWEMVDLWKPYDSDQLYLVDNKAKTYTLINHDFATGNTNLAPPISYESQSVPDGDIHVSGRFNADLGDYELFINHDATRDVYQTADGANWTYLSKASEDVWRKGWLADPSNDNLYAGGFQLNKTLDLVNWEEQYPQWWVYYSLSKDSMHVDVMNLEYFEKTDGTPFILICNHAGVYVTYDSFNSTTNLGWEGLNVVTLYDQTTAADGFLYCGAQDKGTFVYNGDSEATFDILSTNNVTTGDGMLGVFFNNDQSYYAMLQNGALFCVPDRNGGAQASFPIPGNHKSGWINPMIPTANTADNKVYVAGGNLSGGDGCYLIEMNVDISNGVNWQPTQFNYDFRANSNSGSSVIKAIGMAKSDPNRIYVSTQDATFFLTQDGGTTWIKSPANLPSGMIPWEIISSDNDPNHVFISGTGFSNAGVFESKDGGFTFTPLANGLPDATVYEVALSDEEDMLFAATSEGPFVYLFPDQVWYPLTGAYNPYVDYTTVDNIGDNTIRFGTYGRGVWDFAFAYPDLTATPDLPNAKALFRIYPNPVAGALITLELTEIPRQEVIVEIFDIQGRIVAPTQVLPRGRQVQELDITGLRKGVYLLQLQVNGKIWVETFTKL
ncbi:MAG: T9SS type A sorting domain-containing protein [Bacteroidota bacterium]